MRYTIAVHWHGTLIQYRHRQRITSFVWEVLRAQREMGFEVVILPVD